ncbi:hypothetical protein [Ilumatobacter sp.]|uniref:hypothetical protein n=1 Tax=Ilumatobacter sp. TaxID=1967498 RepID=UPI003AF6BC8E
MHGDAIDLYWIPLGAGAGGALVRWSGRTYEAVAARVAGRPRCDLYHSAMIVTVDGVRTAIEMAPVWTKRGERGVVAEGPVGAPLLGRSRLFRYEVRRWTGGSIPDAAAAVDGPLTISTRSDVARQVVELVPDFPTGVWGRDELRTGDMWNSNSLVSWLLVRASVDLAGIGPPRGGRAPGWDAGVIAASRPSG